MRRWTAVVSPLAVAGLLFGSNTRHGAAQSDCKTIADFATDPVGEFPSGWRVRKEPGNTVYTVREENGVRFLHAASPGLGIQAAKQYEWDVAAYPVLAWSWRLIEFPVGADERDPKLNDSALGVYAVFPHTPVTVKSVKYIWSERVPVGTHLTASRGLTQMRVIRSGTEGKGQWVEERVNVREDYNRYVEESAPPKPAGIAVLTDADDTKSTAQGDYANFRVCQG